MFVFGCQGIHFTSKAYLLDRSSINQGIEQAWSSTKSPIEKDGQLYALTHLQYFTIHVSFGFEILGERMYLWASSIRAVSRPQGAAACQLFGTGERTT